MSLQSEADAVLQGAVANGDVPGVVAAATDRDDTIYEAGFGERVIGSGIAMTTDTVGWIASMTKALTGTAVMQLVEQGRLELDRPAADWVPELSEVQVLEGFADDGQPLTRPPRRPITLRHLLTHTAGFSYEIWCEEIIRYQEAKGIPGIISCQNAALSTPLLFDPGERWEYGINIDWAGKMVEAASGRRLGAYLQEHIFEPLGMRDTAFKLRPDMRARLAKIHQRGDDDGFTALDLEIPQEPEFDMGGGGLYGTVGDYLKFVRLILNRGEADGRQVLRPETVDMMARNQMGECRARGQDRDAALVERRRVLPRHAQDLGPHLHDQHGAGADRAQCRQLGLGRARQLLLLDRSQAGRRRGLPHPDSAVCRQEGRAGVLRVREGGLSPAVLSAAAVRG
jgi:CubicO group peptidase (beta-lactamase class C family)